MGCLIETVRREEQKEEEEEEEEEEDDCEIENEINKKQEGRTGCGRGGAGGGQCGKK